MQVLNLSVALEYCGALDSKEERDSSPRYTSCEKSLQEGVGSCLGTPGKPDPGGRGYMGKSGKYLGSSVLCF